MRLFDLIGILAVAGWLALSGWYVYRHEFRTAPERPADRLDEQVVLHEGDNWLMLQRDQEDVGFVHRTRTRLEGGWLVEYELLLVLELLGKKRPIDVSVKARLDPEAYLREFDAEIEAAGRTISAQGDVDDRTLSLVINPTAQPIQRTVELEDRPRLATHSFNQLVSRRNLRPGDRFENEYFDPTSLGMQTIVMEYVGRETLEMFDREHESRHIKQHVGGETYDAYVDAQGELLIQEFPLEMVAARVEPELGRARAASLRKRAEQVESSSEQGPALEGAGMRTALEMLGIGSEGLPDSPNRPDDGPDASRPRLDAGR